MSTVQSYQYRIDPTILNRKLLTAIESRQSEIASLQVRLEACKKKAQNLLSDIKRLAQISADHVETMSNAIQQGNELSAQQLEIESQLQRVESEIRFLTNHTEMPPAALITLEAMWENGYELRGVETADGLTWYLEQNKTGHQIAIRIAKPVREGENTHTWDMVAETFEMTGETCLSEIEDFETSVENMGIGNLKRGQFRIYPKDERSRSREKHGVILPMQKQKRQVKNDKAMVR